MAKWPIYILAGGRSSRFGSDKARALIQGETLLVRVARALSPVASRLTIVAETPGKYDDLGLRTIADCEQYRGPLSGLRTAIKDNDATSEDAWILVAACDTAHVHPDWIDQLADQIDDTAKCVAFRSAFWEPLPAFYHTSIRKSVEQLLASKKTAIKDLFDFLPSRSAPLPAGWATAGHINTTEDLRDAKSNLTVKEGLADATRDSC
jgi:molybdenum cofactor guanylyltransferase